ADTGRQVPQGLDLDAGSGINGGKIVGGVGEGNFLLGTVLGNGVADGALSQAGYGIGAAVDQISQYTHGSFPPNKFCGKAYIKPGRAEYTRLFIRFLRFLLTGL